MQQVRTEEEYTELEQLLQDIMDYRRDVQERLKIKKMKEDEKKKAEDIRKSAMETLGHKHVCMHGW